MPLHAKRYQPIIEYMINNHCDNILEIGVCKGDTSIEMLRYSKNKNVNYYGIDLFEMIDEDTFKKEVAIPADTKTQVESFLKTVNPNINLIQGFSNLVVEQIKKLNIRFDMIFIDGGHSYKTVKEDYENYIQFLSDKGKIFFDDYTEEPGFGIKQYVDELVAAGEYDVEIINNTDYVDNYRGYDFKLVSITKKFSQIDKKELNLCTCLTANYKEIYKKIFLKTLNIHGNFAEDYKNISVLDIADLDSMPGATGSVDFRTINYRKLHFIYELIKKYYGQRLMFLDVDIVFFTEFKNEINNLLDEYDMVLQENDEWLNVGVWAMNCNDNVKTLFENKILPLSNVLLKEKGVEKHDLFGEPHDYTGDQDVVNVSIKQSDIKVGRLPIKYYSNHLKNYKFPDYVPKDCVLFHATSCGAGIENKVNLMKNAYFEILKRK